MFMLIGEQVADADADAGSLKLARGSHAPVHLTYRRTWVQTRDKARSEAAEGQQLCICRHETWQGEGLLRV